MTANIGTFQAGWEESRVEEHLTESLLQGKVAVPLPSLSTSLLPKIEGLVAGAPADTARRTIRSQQPRGCTREVRIKTVLIRTIISAWDTEGRQKGEFHRYGSLVLCYGLGSKG